MVVPTVQGIGGGSWCAVGVSLEYPDCLDGRRGRQSKGSCVPGTGGSWRRPVRGVVDRRACSWA